MPLSINGMEFFTSAEVAESVGVSRQTMWRWRKDEKIPAGSKYRDGKVLFTREEVARIKEFAHRVVPLDSGNRSQMGLFELPRPR